MNIKINIARVFAFLFTVFLFLANMSELNQTICNAVMVTSGIICFLHELKVNANTANLRLAAYTMVILCCSIICTLIIGNRSLQYIAGIIAYSGVAMVILTEKIKAKTFKFLYYFAVVCYSVRYALGYATRDVFIKGGILGTDIVLLSLYVCMAFAYRREGKTLGIFSVLCGALPVIFGLKRMAIIVWILLILFQAVYDRKYNRIKIVKGAIITIVVLVLGYFLVNRFFPDYLHQLLSRFEYDGVSIKGFTYSRQSIWTAYLRQMSCLKNALFGSSFLAEEILTIYRGNAHQSILNCHATVGLLGVVMCLYVVCKRVVLLFRMHDIYLTGLLIIFLLRGMSDAVYWFNWGDIVLNVLLFYPIGGCLDGKNTSQQSNERF